MDNNHRSNAYEDSDDDFRNYRDIFITESR